jgi:hypothetical protein
MNFFKISYYSLLLALITTLFSCSKKDAPQPTGELDGLKLVRTFAGSTHKVDLYTPNGKLQTGYNRVYFQVRGNDGNTLNDVSAEWIPMMYMMGMSHSCPFSEITRKQGAQSTFGGYIVFQMAGNESEYWELAIRYSIAGKDYEVKDRIEVAAAPRRNVETFTGSDNNRYVLAMIDPASPRVAVNDMTAMVFQMKSMMSFVPVGNCLIKIDPRMPGMGNHSSPNNEDLAPGPDLKYYGKLSLTMTGYWKINLRLMDASGNILKGEPVSESNEASSIFFELEF